MPATQSKKENAEEYSDKVIRSMRVDEAAKLAFKIPPTVGFIMLGPPGIGKTENVIAFATEEAKRLGKELVVLNELRAEKTHDEYIEKVREIMTKPDKHYVVSIVPFGATMPDDLLGVPNIVTVKDGDKVIGVFEESALKGSLALLTIKGIHGVLVIDDALNAHDNVRRSFLLAVFQERLVGGFNGVKLSPNVRVIATGNLASESDLANPLPRPMVGRALMVYVKPGDLQSWYNVMEARYKDAWYKDVYAFLKRYEGLYNAPNLIEDEIPTGPVPRAWTLLAKVLHSLRDEIPEMLRTPEGKMQLTSIVAASVGANAAMQFVAFISKPVISVEEVITNPDRLDEVAKDMDLTLRFGVHLADRLDSASRKGEKEKVIKYLTVLGGLMDRTSNDVGVFVYEMLSPEARQMIKSVLTTMSSSKDPMMREVANKIRQTLVAKAVADTLTNR